MKRQALSHIIKQRTVAIIHHVPLTELDQVVQALLHGGIDIIEISLSINRASACIRKLVTNYGARAVVGVGTVLNAAAYREAVSLGADFVATPHVIPEVMNAQHSADVKVIASALTPAETAAARSMGSEIVKLFPAAAGGPNYIRLLLGPYPDLRLLPTGGLTTDNAADYLKAGAVAVGLTSPLTHGQDGLLSSTEITTRARRLVQAVGRK